MEDVRIAKSPARDLTDSSGSILLKNSGEIFLGYESEEIRSLMYCIRLPFD
jgi:hypothetical protein